MQQTGVHLSCTIDQLMVASLISDNNLVLNLQILSCLTQPCHNRILFGITMIFPNPYHTAQFAVCQHYRIMQAS